MKPEAGASRRECSWWDKAPGEYSVAVLCWLRWGRRWRFCSIVLSLNHCRLLNRLGSLKQNLSQVSLLALWDILSHLRPAQQPEMSEKRSSIWFVILQCATDLMPENIHFYAAAPTVWPSDLRSDHVTVRGSPVVLCVIIFVYMLYSQRPSKTSASFFFFFSVAANVVL